MLPLSARQVMSPAGAVVAGGVAATHTRRGLEMVGVTIGVAAQRPTRQPVERVVGERLGVARPAKSPRPPRRLSLPGAPCYRAEAAG